MLRGQISAIAYGDIENLCVDQTPESRTLEFKRTLPGRTDKDRYEFAKDIAAFANSGGGDIVFGIDEKDGVANAVVPISDETADAACRRLGQIIDSAIEPNIFGMQLRPIVTGDSGFVLVARVPASFAGPHRITLNGHNRFVKREAAYTRDMSYAEIRAEFLKMGDLHSLAEKARSEGIKRVLSRTTWKPIISGPACLVQVIPIAATTQFSVIDITRIYNDYSRFMMKDWGGIGRLLNFDGAIFHHGGKIDEIYSFIQIHRNGMMEAISFAGHSFTEDKIIPSVTLTEFIRDSVQKFTAVLKDYDLSGPAIATVSLMNVKEYTLGIGGHNYLPTKNNADREVMPYPSVLIENAEPGSINDITRPILDMIWQSFGMATCFFFSENGEWAPPR